MTFSPASTRSSSPSAAASTARISRGRPPTCSAATAPSASRRTVPAIPIGTGSLRCRSRASSASATRSCTPASSSGPTARTRRTAATSASTSCTRRCPPSRGTRGFQTIADGANADDRGDYRPGRQAAREFGVRSPLDDADLTKDDIRELSRRAGLPTWDEPASACLSSRIPYHSEVTGEKLRMIERAEDALRDLGFRVCRVRHHDETARVEIGRDELPRALEADTSERIVSELRAIGYHDVTIDPRGYRMGSLNEGVVLRPA